MVVLAGAYFTAGVEKLVHSGLEWVTGDNMRWVLYQAAAGGRVALRDIPLWIADRPWLAHVVAAGILATELTAPLVLVWRRFRPAFVVARGHAPHRHVAHARPRLLGLGAHRRHRPRGLGRRRAAQRS